MYKFRPELHWPGREILGLWNTLTTEYVNHFSRNSHPNANRSGHSHDLTHKASGGVSADKGRLACRMRPPRRAEASSRRRSGKAACRAPAAVRPATPAPTTTTLWYAGLCIARWFALGSPPGAEPPTPTMAAGALTQGCWRAHY